MLRKLGLSTALALTLCHAAGASEAPDAIDQVQALLHAHQLVAIAEHHAIGEDDAFILGLVNADGFADAVDVISIDFGASAHQAVLDEYLSGAAVPADQLERVWTDHSHAPMGSFSSDFYSTLVERIRRINENRPDDPIRVIIADPPIDWSAPDLSSEWRQALSARETFWADTLRAPLESGDHILAIGGLDHFSKPDSAGQRVRDESEGYVVIATTGPDGLTHCPIQDIWAELDAPALIDLSTEGVATRDAGPCFLGSWTSGPNGPEPSYAGTTLSEAADYFLFLGAPETLQAPGTFDSPASPAAREIVARRTEALGVTSFDDSFFAPFLEAYLERVRSRDN